MSLSLSQLINIINVSVKQQKFFFEIISLSKKQRVLIRILLNEGFLEAYAPKKILVKGKPRQGWVIHLRRGLLFTITQASTTMVPTYLPLFLLKLKYASSVPLLILSVGRYGLITQHEAIKRGIGGKLVCEIW